MIRAKINITDVATGKVKSLSIPHGDWYDIAEAIQDDLVPRMSKKSDSCRVQVMQIVTGQYNRSVTRTYHGVSALELLPQIKKKFK